MLTGKQLAALSELLHTCRPDWDTRGCQAALRRVDDTWAWPAICQHAITTAANAANQTPDTIAWTGQPVPPAVADREWCGVHETNTRLRGDGQRACCWAEGAEPAPSSHRPHPAPPGLRAQVAAALNVPAHEHATKEQ